MMASLSGYIVAIAWAVTRSSSSLARIRNRQG
jgi:hypothetical protein